VEAASSADVLRTTIRSVTTRFLDSGCVDRAVRDCATVNGRYRIAIVELIGLGLRLGLATGAVRALELGLETVVLLGPQLVKTIRATTTAEILGIATKG
jgi:hypothetical protein